jgi:hypothetical protein
MYYNTKFEVIYYVGGNKPPASEVSLDALSLLLMLGN